ncbi:general substrate transporter [Mycena sanguinolenta]|nr:general substrate transporter [Mycena sanguinolenta]
MARLARIEDRPTPEEVYNWKVYFNAIIATWAAVMIGYDSAFIGTSISLASFKSEFGLTTKSTSEFNFISANIVSVFQAGCFFGAFFGYFTGYFIGRKYGLLLSSAIFILGAGLQCGANSSTGLGIMYAGRIIVGFGIGIASNLAPIYVAEIAPPAIRGRLIGMYELCWQFGGVIGFWINYGVTQHIPASHKQWFIAFGVQLIPGCLLFIGSFFMVESPRWLVSRDRNAEALKNLATLRNLPEDAPYVVEEYTEIEAAIAHERSLAGAGFFGPLKTVFASKTLRYRVLLGSSLFIWQNGTGINAINYYSPTIFKSIGIVGGNTSLLTTGVYGLIKLVGALIWLLYLVDSFGRRGVLLIGSIGGAISMYYIGAYIAIAKPADHPTTKLTSGGQSAIAFFYIWTIFYSPTWNGTPWVVGAEMFPQHVRTFTQACQAASNWFWGFIITRFTPQMFTSMGYGVYIFFASLMVVSVPFIYFILPETKQVPLERMEELFAPGVKPWKAHAIVMARVHETRQMRNDVAASGKESPASFEKGREERAEAV